MKTHLKRVVEERVLYGVVGGAGVDEAEAEPHIDDACGLRAVQQEVERVGLREQLLLCPDGLPVLVVSGRLAVDPRGERETRHFTALVVLVGGRAHEKAHY